MLPGRAVGCGVRRCHLLLSPSGRVVQRKRRVVGYSSGERTVRVAKVPRQVSSVRPWENSANSRDETRSSQYNCFHQRCPP